MRARLARAAISFWGLGSAMLLVALSVAITAFAGLERFTELGLLQPMLAGLLSLAFVMGIWIAKGRFVNERRKGVSSASSSAIAVRLWAICFALLFTSMMVSAVVNTAQRHPLGWIGASKITEVSRDEVLGPQGNSTSTSVKVTR